ncbi:hypothetical protein BGX31_010177 [Mortierella sp. GBA43]|nr:hypothetical protein BGX31_010177 [Mortierella sp. GBA43]
MATRTAISSQDVSKTTPRSSTPVSESAETASLTSVTKKVSLAKRISRLFIGGSKNNKASSTAATSTGTGKKDQTSKPPTENIDNGEQDLLPPNGVFHLRSQSSPETHRTGVSNNNSNESLGTIHEFPIRNSMIQDARNRKTRDSGFEEMDTQGHRRYSSSTTLPPTPTSATPTRSSFLLNPRQRMSALLNEEEALLYMEQQQHRGQASDSIGRSTPAPGGALGEHSRPRRTTLGDGSVRDVSQHFVSAQGRRGSAPVITETLVSRIDREKSTVCFQTPALRRGSHSRDPNMDPALSNLAQQHRRDFQVNTRLGGVGVPTPPPSAPLIQLPHQQQLSQPMTDSQMQAGRERDVRASAPRRGSSSSLQLGISQHYPSGTATPGVGPKEPNRRYSSFIPPQIHPYPAGSKSALTGSHGNLLQTTTPAPGRSTPQPSQPSQPSQPVQQPSPQLAPQGTQFGSQGRNRSSPKRQSSAGYFTTPQQQQQQSSAGNISPFPSPVLGSSGTFANAQELPVALQHQQYQQQQVQLHIQQQQLQQLQQQQQLQPQQQVYQTVASPIALLQNHVGTQHLQQQQQQLEQLQQMRVQQQQLLIQQQQQLQQQLEQARTAVASPLTVAPFVQQHQQQALVNNMPLHFALPAAPVLTTAMGVGMGMNMNPSGMGMVSLVPSMGAPQLVMTPQLGPQLMTYSATPLYYQQAGGIAAAAAMAPVAPAAGGRAVVGIETA